MGKALVSLGVSSPNAVVGDPDVTIIISAGSGCAAEQFYSARRNSGVRGVLPARALSIVDNITSLSLGNLEFIAR